VEDETWACGTGATACAISYAIDKNDSSIHSVNVEVKGGKLQILFETEDLKSFSNVFLIGPAEYVYKGELDV
jgi:diaminopimelate epimerase